MAAFPEMSNFFKDVLAARALKSSDAPPSSMEQLDRMISSKEPELKPLASSCHPEVEMVKLQLKSMRFSVWLAAKASPRFAAPSSSIRLYPLDKQILTYIEGSSRIPIVYAILLR
jgi:hypothetical protein